MAMDYVRLHARLHPDKPAVNDLTFERRWTYDEFDRLIACCTAVLAEEGVVEGDRVACLSKNRAEIVSLHLACARLGAIFVPLNWRLSASELEIIVADCEPSVIYGDDMAAALGVNATDIEQILGRCDAEQPVWPEQKSEDLPSLMLYTSGTTGAPKGVLLSERNLTETAINFTLLGEVNSDSHFLCESPMFHIIGIVTSVRPPLLCGAEIALSDTFVPGRTFSRLADPALSISHYFCVPQMALAIRAVEGFDASRLSGLTAIFTGGAPHPETQIRDWLNDGIAIVDGFGMSEAGTVFGMPLDRSLIDRKAGCVGVATPRVQARIVDDKDQPVAVGTPGELQLKGDNITLGYWRRDAEYKETFTADGWFRTGDILTRDGDGYFRVTDRKKDMYISGGENVYPVEVEAHLDKYPGVSELAVIGVPDPKWGEVGCLFYVSESSEISLEDVDAFLTTRLARYKIPKQARRVKALPRNGVGKLMRHDLRKIYREKQS
jgi:fatty-acyl-CoA synthase